MQRREFQIIRRECGEIPKRDDGVDERQVRLGLCRFCGAYPDVSSVENLRQADLAVSKAQDGQGDRTCSRFQK